MFKKKRIVAFFITFVFLFINFNNVLANTIDNSTKQMVNVVTVKKQPSSNNEIKIVEAKDKDEIENELKNYKRYTPKEYTRKKVEQYQRLLSNPYYELRNREERYLETYVEFNTNNKPAKDFIVIIDIGNEIDSIHQFELDVYITNKDIEEYEFLVDENGDRKIAVRIPFVQANQKYRLTIVQKFEIATPHFYDINVLKQNPDYSDFSQYERYISEEPKIETSYQPIIDKSHELLDSQTNVYDKILKAYEWIQFSMEYDFAYGNRGAKSAIDNLKGVCEDYAKLLIALLRVQKIPAREVVGFRNIENLSTYYTPVEVSGDYHAWVEVYFPNIGWLPMDPTTHPEPKYNAEKREWEKTINLREFIQDFPSSEHIISDYNDSNWLTYYYHDYESYGSISKLDWGWTLSAYNLYGEKTKINPVKLDFVVSNTTYRSIDLKVNYEGTKSLDYVEITVYDSETNEKVDRIRLYISGTNIKDYPAKVNNLVPNKKYKIEVTGVNNDGYKYTKKTTEVKTLDIKEEDKMLLKPRIENVITSNNSVNFDIVSEENHYATKFRIEVFNVQTGVKEKTYDVSTINLSYINVGILDEIITGLKSSTSYTLKVIPYYYSYVGLYAQTQFTTKSDVKVTGIKLNMTNKTVYKGEGFNLYATVAPSNATNKGVIWSSSNTKVAVVDKYGKVATVGTGTAVITAKTVDGGFTAKCTVTVKAPIKVQGVKLNKSTLTLKRVSGYKLVATVLPSNATNKNVVWTTSNSKVVKVDAYGKVYAVDKGTAVVTVSTKDGGYKRSCKVYVK
ncbi:Ig-like domain-containing protein [Caloramator proteoclasticus]|uniref:Ig-like domain (Group 2) n=1 Tax=Caloramator proteoclasticus DSM 10124 TaxID=1121262 RepID=A0A1M4WK17_9CLOT|nr:Ig-like domain-containing protein [Caloramator proteoclasticus]SHE81423.1 Ig-like domain (group 2) [Caloramator proteoclasticus DSM 10124]